MSLLNLSVSSLQSIIDKYKTFFESLLNNAINTFEREYQEERKNNQLIVDNQIKQEKETVNNLSEINDDYIKEPIQRIEKETKIPYGIIKQIGKEIKADLLEMIDCRYIPSDVSKILEISSPQKITEIASLLSMFSSRFLVQRDSRLKNHKKPFKSGTTVRFSLLGILYLRYWLKDSSALESYFIFENQSIRKDIIDSFIAYEKGKTKQYQNAKEAIKSLGL